MATSDNTSTKIFVTSLLEAIPQARGVFDEHIDYYEELLPHVMFGDLTRWVIDLYRSSKGAGEAAQEAASVLGRTLEFLEESYSSSSTDSEVLDLIGVSFLENLHQAGPDYDGLKSQLGPSLRKQLEWIED